MRLVFNVGGFILKFILSIVIVIMAAIAETFPKNALGFVIFLLLFGIFIIPYAIWWLSYGEKHGYNAWWR